ncbi:Uncharacterized protein OBRU01_00432, partial [Operophtera brumata]
MAVPALLDKHNWSIMQRAESKDDGAKEHLEYHRLDAVKADGALVSRLEQHASADSVAGGTPRVHSQAQLDVPSEGVHRVIVQDGAHVSVIDGTATAAPSEEPTTKVFHGAARLVQPGSLTNVPPSGHTAVRRAFNADITKETKNNMTKEEAIAFLQEIKFNIDYLRTHYTQNMKAAEESAQQEKLRNMLLEQAQAKSFPFGNSPDILRTIASKTWDLSNNLTPMVSLPVTTDLRPETVKRFDPMLQTNII